EGFESKSSHLFHGKRCGYMLTIAGIGPGNPQYLTVDVAQKIEKADIIIAFGRVGSSIKNLRDDYIQVKKVDEVMDKLHHNKDMLLLASGDPNFFGIVNYIKKKGIHIDEVLPGLSSFQYMMAKLKKPWQEAEFISLHGRYFNFNEIIDKRLIIALIDKDNGPSYISNALFKQGMQGTIYVGFNLSYEDERIIEATIGDEIQEYSSLGV